MDRAANNGSEYIFYEKAHGETPRHYAHTMSSVISISRIFTQAGVESAGNLVSHRLRDTLAVDLLTKGVPLEEVSKLLGHSSTTTTEKHYAKWAKSRQDRLTQIVMNTWTAI